MSDFIRRKDAVELLKNDIENNGLPLDDEYNIGIDHAMCLLACIPTAEPKVGKWKPYLPEYGDMFECSVCEEVTRLPYKPMRMPYNYCPNCGAKMERRTDEGTTE